MGGVDFLSPLEVVEVRCGERCAHFFAWSCVKFFCHFVDALCLVTEACAGRSSPDVDA